MLVFIGSIRHPETAHDFKKVESLLASTLYSVCNQTDDKFKVLIVCNKKPRIVKAFNDSFVEFVEVEFPCTPCISRTDLNMRKALLDETRKDKGAKYLVGIAEAQKFNPDYIMIFDTDDFVSSNIAWFVNASGNNHNGWFIEKGYIYDMVSGICYEDDQFNQCCGTSLIINNDLLVNPADRGIIHISSDDAGVLAIDTSKTSFTEQVSRFSSKEDILNTVDYNYLRYIVGSHRWAEQYYGLSPLPFRGAIWNINTGENNITHRNVKRKISINTQSIDMLDFVPDNIIGF